MYNRTTGDSWYSLRCTIELQINHLYLLRCTIELQIVRWYSFRCTIELQIDRLYSLRCTIELQCERWYSLDVQPLELCICFKFCIFPATIQTELAHVF